MRLPCPHCGTRDVQEFTYRGDAGLRRPEAEGASPAAMAQYVYERDNPAGRHREYWRHSAGCRAWIVVTRDTRTHRVESAEPARLADAWRPS
jgi:heterotetrameric sarcosine oxidase delta subunit